MLTNLFCLYIIVWLKADIRRRIADIRQNVCLRRILKKRRSRTYGLKSVICIEVWLSLVERCVRDAEAASSSLVTSTKLRVIAFAVALNFFVTRLEKPGFAKQNCDLSVNGRKGRVRAGATVAPGKLSHLDHLEYS